MVQLLISFSIIFTGNSWDVIWIMVHSLNGSPESFKMNPSTGDKTSASDLMSLATKTAGVNTFVISSCRMLRIVTQQLLPRDASSGLHTPQISPQRCILGRRRTGCSSFGEPAKNLHENGARLSIQRWQTSLSDCAECFIHISGRSSDEQHLGVNNKVVQEFFVFVYCFCSLFIF